MQAVACIHLQHGAWILPQLLTGPRGPVVCRVVRIDARRAALEAGGPVVVLLVALQARILAALRGDAVVTVVVGTPLGDAGPRGLVPRRVRRLDLARDARLHAAGPVVVLLVTLEGRVLAAPLRAAVLGPAGTLRIEPREPMLGSA